MQAEVILTFEELNRLVVGWLPVFGLPLDAEVLELAPLACCWRWHTRSVDTISNWPSGGGYLATLDVGDDEPEQTFEYLGLRSREDREHYEWDWRRSLVQAAGLTPVAWEPPGSPYQGSRPRRAPLAVCTAKIRPISRR